jgi:hypothetical protein
MDGPIDGASGSSGNAAWRVCGQLDIDRCQQLGVEQRAVSNTAGAINAVARAQVVESVVSAPILNSEVANLPYISQGNKRASFTPGSIFTHWKR